jgi:hypothetical protein
LLTIEALNAMLVHTIFLFRDGWHSLDKADHGFIALRVELLIITSLEVGKLVSTIFSWVLRDLCFNGILKVRQESKTIVKLNFE